MTYSPLHKIGILIGLAALGMMIYFIMDANDVFLKLQDGKSIQQYLETFGVFGPVMIILLMTIAILISPLPSAPIAIASGAVYGHFWGTLYVLVGSICGATGAFCVTRCLGYDYINKHIENFKPFKFAHSQDTLMGIVFISRLIPFLSFDIISYAAGLTPLLFWRFLLATLFGIAPASFFLAHVGSEMASAELNRIAAALLLLAVLTAVPLLIRFFQRRLASKRNLN